MRRTGRKRGEREGRDGVQNRVAPFLRDSKLSPVLILCLLLVRKSLLSLQAHGLSAGDHTLQALRYLGVAISWSSCQWAVNGNDFCHFHDFLVGSHSTVPLSRVFLPTGGTKPWRWSAHLVHADKGRPQEKVSQVWSLDLPGNL